jgi:hypothetical protein
MSVAQLHRGPQETDPTAVASLICGIVTVFMPLAAIPAVICGHLSRSKIKKSGGRITGGGMALAGLIIGYIYCTVLFAIFGFLVFVSIALNNHH